MPEKVSQSPEIQQTPDKEAQLRTIEYLCAPERPLTLQLAGEYVKFFLTGEFNPNKVKTLIWKNMEIALDFELEISYFDTKWYDVTDDHLEVLNMSIPPEVVIVLKRVEQDLRKINLERAQQLAQTPEITRLAHIIHQLVDGPKPEESRVFLKQHEKDNYVRDQVSRRTIPDSDDLDLPESVKQRMLRQNPVYRTAQREAEVMEKSGKLQEEPKEAFTDEELEVILLQLIHNLYFNVQEALDPQYNRLNDQDIFKLDSQKEPFHISGQDYRNFLVLTMHQLEFRQPDLFYKFIHQFYLINIIQDQLRYRKLPPETLQKQKDKVKQELLNFPGWLSEEMLFPGDISQPFTTARSYLSLVEYIQKFKQPSLKTETAPKQIGKLGKMKNALQVLQEGMQHLRNVDLEREIFSGMSDPGDRLKTKEMFDADQRNVVVYMTGNPLHLSRFSSAISFYSEGSDRAESFVDYPKFIQEKSLTSKATLRSKKFFTGSENQPNVVYLPTPQFAPIAEIEVGNDLEDASHLKLELGSDYQLEYEKMTGQYRLILSSDRAKQAAKNGLAFKIGLDYVENQRELPAGVDSIPLDPEKVTTVSDALRKAGFDRLADKLQESLKPSLLKKLKLQFTGQKFVYTSQHVAEAVRKSIEYAFADSASEELQIAIKVVSSGIDENFNFSYLPRPKEGKQNALIGLQCTQVAKLYAELINFLLSENEVDGKAYTKSMFIDTTQGLSSLLGFKAFSSAHMNTEAVITQQNSGQEAIFNDDLVPGEGVVKKTLHKVKNTGLIIADFISELSKLREKMNGELEPVEVMYLEIASNKKSFDQYVLQLKRDLAVYIPELSAKPNELEKFVEANAGLYNPPEKLLEVMKRKPMAAVLNAVLFLQDKGQRAMSMPTEIQQIKKAMQTEVEWFARVRNTVAEGMTPQQQRLREMNRSFTDELSRASQVAEKLLILINAFERIEKQEKQQVA